jgi:thiamine-monophosphate kinase
MPDGPRLGDLGEEELIRRLGAFAPPGQFLDDAALVSCSAGALVINTDLLVEGVHFSDATTGPVDVGWRAAAANLSDLAATGCLEVAGLTVGLAAPPGTQWSWVEGVYEGLTAALAPHGGVLLGGDCSAAGQRMLAVTALGRLSGGSAGEGIHRRDGRPGDCLVSTGPHGLSRLGLALLRRRTDQGDALPAAPSPDLERRALQAHRRPRARLDAVAALVASRPHGLPWRVGGCDSSDGLIAAVAAVARASGCGAVLERGALPLDPAMVGWPQAQDWCLAGGEDFELVLSLEPEWGARLEERLPGASRIGRLVESGGTSLIRWDGNDEPLDPSTGGFVHFS